RGPGLLIFAPIFDEYTARRRSLRRTKCRRHPLRFFPCAELRSRQSSNLVGSGFAGNNQFRVICNIKPSVKIEQILARDLSKRLGRSTLGTAEWIRSIQKFQGLSADESRVVRVLPAQCRYLLRF